MRRNFADKTAENEEKFLQENGRHFGSLKLIAIGASGIVFLANRDPSLNPTSEVKQDTDQQMKDLSPVSEINQSRSFKRRKSQENCGRNNEQHEGDRKSTLLPVVPEEGFYQKENVGDIKHWYFRGFNDGFSSGYALGLEKEKPTKHIIVLKKVELVPSLAHNVINEILVYNHISKLGQFYQNYFITCKEMFILNGCKAEVSKSEGDEAGINTACSNKTYVYFTMEKAQGTVFDLLIYRDKTMPKISFLKDEKNMASLIKSVAFAVFIAHVSGVFHEDIKSNNIFMFHDGRVKLGDYDMSQLVGEVQTKEEKKEEKEEIKEKNTTDFNSLYGLIQEIS